MSEITLIPLNLRSLTNPHQISTTQFNYQK